MNVEETLKDRNSQYGDYWATAGIAQNIKAVFRSARNWDNITLVQAESIEMIATKLARILNGGFNQADSFHDIAGYAKLAEDDILRRREMEKISYASCGVVSNQPPINNDHVAEGCDKFTDDEIALNADKGSNVVSLSTPVAAEVSDPKNFV